MGQIVRNYINIFIDKEEYPFFIDEYLATPTLQQLKGRSQFCGCDYVLVYTPRDYFTRYDHSEVTGHTTWHFSHNKKQAIKAVCHDRTTPCFSHTVDFVKGDYIKQESSEKHQLDSAVKDKKLMSLLKRDGIELEELYDLSDCPILENSSPRLCTDRLDGVLHTGYIWLQSHSLETIEKIYNGMAVLEKDGQKEIGFIDEEQGIEFAKIVSVYAKEIQSTRNKYVMIYIAELIKDAINKKKIFTMNDLYDKSEEEIIRLLANNYSTWNIFTNTHKITTSDEPPQECFFVHQETKKRNTIPLLQKDGVVDRITNLSREAENIYEDIENFKDKEYGFIKTIKRII